MIEAELITLFREASIFLVWEINDKYTMSEELKYGLNKVIASGGCLRFFRGSFSSKSKKIWAQIL